MLKKIKALKRLLAPAGRDGWGERGDRMKEMRRGGSILRGQLP